MAFGLFDSGQGESGVALRLTTKSRVRSLSLPNVVCVGGSWVAPKDLVARGDWASITKLAAEAFALKG